MNRIKYYLFSLFILSMFSIQIAYGSDNSGVRISGIWIFNDVKKMCSFLGIKKLPTYNYCLKIEENEKEGYVYFVVLSDPIKVSIEKRNNTYSLLYNKKKRDFEIKVYSNDDLAWGFKDMCKQNRCFFSGSLYTRKISNKELKRILDWIKKEDSLPDAPPPF